MIAPPPPCRCEAVIVRSDDHALLWRKIRGKLSWPLLSPIPHRVASGGFLEGRTSDLDAEQLAVLYDFIAHYRRIERQDVQRELQLLGWVPIPERSVRVAHCQLHPEIPA